MNYRKIVASTLAVVMCGISLFSSRIALASSRSKVFSTRSTFEPFSVPIIKELGSISVKQKIVSEKKEYKLYCTFDNPKNAINRLYDSAPTILKELETHYGLDRMTIHNWEQHRDSLFEFIDCDDCPVWLNEGNVEYQKLRAFFDIIENDSMNEEILNIASRINKNGDYISRIAYEDLLFVLPYQEVADELVSDGIRGYAGFDTTSGIAYANRWATDRNTAQYHSFKRADCANFTSQILENGGIQQVVYQSEHQGWWHTRTVGFLGIVTNKHSRSWTIADVFARYMGVSYTTTSNIRFSMNILPGDFIAGDWDSDGNWDHMGFITDRRPIENKSWYDYKVAQHTSDYNRWWTDDNNGWEETGANGGTFARIRRPG